MKAISRREHPIDCRLGQDGRGFFLGLQRNTSVIMRRAIRVFLVLVLCGAVTRAQDTAATQPAVTFTFDFPGSEPDHYVITVAADGHATYTSTGKLSDQAEDGETFRLDFSISQPTLDRIFDLTKRAHYFDGDMDSRKKGLASTGVKTLAYKDAQRTKQATYNFSPVPAVQELTQIFQGISATLEFGHRLEYYHRYQKLALDDETKRLEQMAKDQDLAELQALAGILQQIANDTTVINVVRARAARLLDRAQHAGAR